MFQSLGFWKMFVPVALAALVALPGVFYLASGSASEGGTFLALLSAGIFFLWGLLLLFKRADLPHLDVFVLVVLLSLIIATILSAWLSAAAWHLSWFGADMEFGTVGSFLILSAVLILASQVPKNLLWFVWGLFVFSALGSGVFVLMKLLSGSSISQILGTHWPDFTFFMSSATLVACVSAETYGGLLKKIFTFAAPVLLVFSFWLNYKPAILVLGVAVLAAAGLLFFSGRGKKPFLSLVIAGSVLIFGMFGGYLVSADRPAELRLSPFSSVFLVLAPSYFSSYSNLILGTGPGTFSVAWERYRPVEFNIGPYWNKTINKRYSDLMTLFVSNGILGSVSLLGIGVALGTLVFRKQEFFDLTVLPISLVFFALLGIVFFSPGVYSLVLIGAGLGLLSGTAREETEHRRGGGFLRIFIGILMLTVAGAVFVVALRQYVAVSYAAYGSLVLNKDSGRAAELLASAANFWPTPYYQRESSRAFLSYAFSLAENTEAFGKYVRNSVDRANSAVDLNPKDYLSQLNRAVVFVSLASSGVGEALPKAKDFLNDAETFSLHRPEAAYLKAVILRAEGDAGGARAAIEEALRRKPDYTEALTFKKSLLGQ